MSPPPLDRPIWQALTGRQATFAIGEGPALRFRPDVSPFAACADDNPHSLAALTRLMAPGETIVFLQRGSVPLPPDTVEIDGGRCVQMVARQFPASPPAAGLVALDHRDAGQMLALAKLTNPGPFRARTIELSQFWGVKDDGGRLLAMAGERLKLPGMSEVSGVCTHPDARGRGYARLLSAHVASEIVRRGETPFLHAWATNHTAIRLYEALGFELSCEVEALAVALV